MKKRIISIILAFSLIYSIICVAYADTNTVIYVPVGASSGTYYKVEYQTLCAMAARFAEELGTGWVDANNGKNLHIEMEYHNGRWTVQVYNYSGTLTGYMGGYGGFIYYAPYDPILYAVESINTKLTNINTKINTIATSVEYFLKNWDDKQYCSSILDSNGNEYDSYTISRSVADNIVAQLNANRVSRPITFIANDNTLASYDFVFAYTDNGLIRVKVYNPNTGVYYTLNLCTQDHLLIKWVAGGSSSSFDDTDILSAIDGLDTDLLSAIDELHPVSYATTLSYNSGTIDNPYGAGVALLSYLNEHFNGRKIRVWTSNTTYTEYDFLYCRWNSVAVDAYISIFVDNNGVPTEYYLCTSNRNVIRFRTNNDRQWVFMYTKLDNIYDKLSAIYNFLDDNLNSDDIDDYLDGFGDDIDGYGDKIVSSTRLFKVAFNPLDDNYDLDVLGDAIGYLNEFWSIGEESET